MRQAKPVLIAALGLGLALAVAGWLWRQAPEAALVDVSPGGAETTASAPRGGTAEGVGPVGSAAATQARPSGSEGANGGGGATASTHGAGADDPEGAAAPGHADGPSGEPSVWPVDAEGIRGAMMEALPGVQDCYEGWLAVNPDIAGRVELSFTIDAVDTGGAVGGVTELSVPHSELGHTAMESCVANVAAGLQFDVPDEPMQVTYPFVFEIE